MANYLDARTPQKNNAMLGEVMPSGGIAPGGFGQWSGQTQKGPAVDPVREAQGFAIKYSALFVVSIFLAWGITAKGGQSIVWGLSFFGVVVFAGYFALSLMENIFERESGHVVWAFFGTIVELFRLWFSYKLMVIEKSNENLRLRLDAYEQRALAAQRNAIVDKQATPQSSRNQLANYVPAPVHPPLPPGALAELDSTMFEPEDLIERNDGTDAKAILLDFVAELYENAAYTNDSGVLLVQAPWAKASANPASVKKQMRDMLGQMAPKLFTLTPDKRAWRHNGEDYPDCTSAYSAIEKAIVVGVGG